MANPTEIKLPATIGSFVKATNDFDIDGMMSLFVDDALVNDNQREFWGKDAIRRFLNREFIGDKVTVDVVRTAEHFGDVIVTAKVDGTFPKEGLPDPLFLTFYFTLQDRKITKLFVMRNRPTPAYLVYICREVFNRKELEIYWSKIGPTFEGHPIKPLAAYTPYEILEDDGSHFEGITVHEFPSVDAAKSWYYSPAYTEIREKHRFKGARYLGVLIEGGITAPADRMPQTKD